ncbi:MAG: DUF2970 domain-containing protein [Pigmentiphaga sp.]|nr:DUF2970 domain-containing protein [Pigmentiphaga sp.]
MTDPEKREPRKLNFFQTVGAILWAFTGLRRGRDYHLDAQKLNPVHVILTGLILALVFVVILVLLARWAVA